MKDLFLAIAMAAVAGTAGYVIADLIWSYAVSS